MEIGTRIRPFLDPKVTNRVAPQFNTAPHRMRVSTKEHWDDCFVGLRVIYAAREGKHGCVTNLQDLQNRRRSCHIFRICPIFRDPTNQNQRKRSFSRMLHRAKYSNRDIAYSKWFWFVKSFRSLTWSFRRTLCHTRKVHSNGVTVLFSFVEKGLPATSIVPFALATSNTHAQNKYHSDKYTRIAVRVRSGTLFDGICGPHALP